MKKYLLTVVACLNFLLVSSPAFAYRVGNVEDVTDGTGLCLKVTTAAGQQFSYPTPTNSFNSSTEAQFLLDGATLGAAQISFQQLNSTNPTAVLRLFWDIGPGDPNCYGLPQIRNLRYEP